MLLLLPFVTYNEIVHQTRYISIIIIVVISHLETHACDWLKLRHVMVNKSR